MSRLAIAAAAAAALVTTGAHAQLSFTLFHHSDAESSLVSAPGQANYGGVHRFKSKLDQLRTLAGPNTLTVSNGDMFLAGAQFNASQVRPAPLPFYDSIALDRMGYNVMGLGNHEFDFTPTTTRRFIDGFTTTTSPWVATNVNFAGEPQLAPLAPTRLAKSHTVTIGGQQVGVVGALTPLLPSISSPGGVNVNANVVASLQAEIDSLTAGGVKHIVLLSHLQNIEEEIALIPQLKGVDVVVAGGGEELVANAGVPLVPGDTRPATIGGISALTNQYPLIRSNNDGDPTALVSVAGQYKYIGQLNLSFDAAGKLVPASTSGNPVRVAGLASGQADAVADDAGIAADVVAPVNAHIAVLAANKLAESQVALEGRRTTPNPNIGIRTSETNLGNLTADALKWQAAKSAAENGTPLNGNRLISLQNGGGIRNNSLIPASPTGQKTFSELDAFNINAFGNFVAVIKNLTPANVKTLLEHSVGNLIGGGQWGHWGGISFQYVRGNAAGNRVLKAWLDDGTILIDGFAPAIGAPTIDLATINFLTVGGDGYPIQSFNLPTSTFPVSYQEALEFYVTSTGTFGGLDGLNGLISSADYASVPADDYAFANVGRRIDAVPEPTVLGLAALTGLTLLARRSRRA